MTSTIVVMFVFLAAAVLTGRMRMFALLAGLYASIGLLAGNLVLAGSMAVLSALALADSYSAGRRAAADPAPAD